MARFFGTQSRDPGEAGLVGFAIERIEVRPAHPGTVLSTETKFATGLLIVHLPRLRGEKDDDFRARELEVHSRFASSLSEAQQRAAIQFFFFLDEDARAELLKRFGGSRRRRQ